MPNVGYTRDFNNFVFSIVRTKPMKASGRLKTDTLNLIQTVRPNRSPNIKESSQKIQNNNYFNKM